MAIDRKMSTVKSQAIRLVNKAATEMEKGQQAIDQVTHAADDPDNQTNGLLDKTLQRLTAHAVKTSQRRILMAEYIRAVESSDKTQQDSVIWDNQSDSRKQFLTQSDSLLSKMNETFRRYRGVDIPGLNQPVEEVIIGDSEELDTNLVEDSQDDDDIINDEDLLPSGRTEANVGSTVQMLTCKTPPHEHVIPPVSGSLQSRLRSEWGSVPWGSNQMFGSQTLRFQQDSVNRPTLPQDSVNRPTLPQDSVNRPPSQQTQFGELDNKAFITQQAPNYTDIKNLIQKEHQTLVGRLEERHKQELEQMKIFYETQLQTHFLAVKRDQVIERRSILDDKTQIPHKTHMESQECKTHKTLMTQRLGSNDDAQVYRHLAAFALPTFDGSPEKFKAFWQAFKEYTDQINAPKIIRLDLLKKACTGTVRKTLEITATTAENYDRVVEDLFTKYDNKRLVTKCIMEKLYALPTSGRLGVQLQQTLDQIKSFERELRGRESTDSMHFKETIWSKFPTQIRDKVLLVSPTDEDEWTTLELLSNMTVAFRKLANAESNRDHRYMRIASTSRCIFCSEFNHMPKECPNSSLAQKFDKITKPYTEDRCRICFETNHFAFDCPEGSCTHCGRDHNSALHTLFLNKVSNKAHKPLLDSETHPRGLYSNNDSIKDDEFGTDNGLLEPTHELEDGQWSEDQ